MCTTVYYRVTCVNNADNIYILQVQVIKDVLPYYQLMTPKWLHKHSIITGNYTIYPHYLELDPTTVIGKPKYQLAL